MRRRGGEHTLTPTESQQVTSLALAEKMLREKGLELQQVPGPRGQTEVCLTK